jgi:hypothetical protein
MEWSKQLKALIKVACNQGWRIERRSKHYLFFPSDRSMPPVMVATTPSSHRTPANTIARLKRAGLIWPPSQAHLERND